MNAVVNIGFCASHRKGGESGSLLDEAAHWEWLEAACDWWLARNRSCGVVVSTTGFRGPLHVGAGRARDALWRVMSGVDVVGDAANPSHQVGAGLTVRLGLEYAGKIGFDYVVHTAEDVLPREGVVGAMLRALEGGAEYAGDAWGVGTPAEGLNAQFFACRVPYLAGRWDAAAIPGSGHIEGYLRDLLRGKRLWLADRPESRYRHTHDAAEWKRWADESAAEGGARGLGGDGP